jgi:hypothetical protein
MQLMPAALKSASQLCEASLAFAQREMELCQFTLLAAHLNLTDEEERGVPSRIAKRTLVKACERYENACKKLGRELRSEPDGRMKS